MTNKSKVRGTRWESTCRGFLRSWWPTVERLAQSGAEDRGDLFNVPNATVECKDARRHELSGWLTETTTEQANNRTRFGVLLVKRIQKPVNKGYFITTIEQGADLLHLAELAINAGLEEVAA